MDADTLEIDLCVSTDKKYWKPNRCHTLFTKEGILPLENDETMCMLLLVLLMEELSFPFSQDLGHLYGKILRLNDDGRIPSDNRYMPVVEGVVCGANGQALRMLVQHAPRCNFSTIVSQVVKPRLVDLLVDAIPPGPKLSERWLSHNCTEVHRLEGEP